MPVEDGARLKVIERSSEDDTGVHFVGSRLAGPQHAHFVSKSESERKRVAHLLRGGIASTAAQWPATAQELAKPPNRAHSTAG